jgi:Tol biopolymer transport system component
MGASRRAARVLLLAFLVSAALPGAGGAQYFGANKVQYKTFRFQVLETEHFDVYFYPAEREGAHIAARLAERWYARLSELFDYELQGRQPLVLYASHVDFEQTHVIPDFVGEGTGGATEPLRRRIVLPLAGPLADTDHVIGHELVHAFQFDLTAPRDVSQGSALARLPLWFIEGMAEYLTLGPVDTHTAMWLRDAVRGGRFPTLRDLGTSEYFPYRWGHALWAYIGGRYGDHAIRRMLVSALLSGDIPETIERVLGTTDAALEAGWHASMQEAYTPLLAAATPPSETGAPVVAAGSLRGETNVGPALSPDGRWIAFLSERGFFSMDLFVADAATGRIVRKLTDTASNPHYTSLQFIYSSGAWNWTSSRLAAATVTGGRAALAVFAWPSGARQVEKTFNDVDEIFNPAWSPDGRSIAFTGMSGGLPDLFVYNLESDELTRLTDDAFTELQPAWSPDGRRLAFATDRFTTRLDVLGSGPYRLAVMDIGTRAVHEACAFTTGKHINPQWSGDGESLFFIADHDGVANVYRVGLAGGEIRQLTTVSTGISGITASSPALSVAPAAGRAAVTVYADGKYAIHTMSLEAPTRAPEAAFAGERSLPPRDRKPSSVAAMLADARRGLPPDGPAPISPYTAGMSLESAGQSMIAVGLDRFGAAVGAGVGFVFSDMLNTHRLSTVLQLNTGLNGNLSGEDTAVQAAYLNQSHRWNWGLVGGQVPYVSGSAWTAPGTIDGQPVEMEQVNLFRQTERAAAALAAYPFNRARRLELGGGMSRMSFNETVRTTAYDAFTGELVYEDISERSLARTLTLATSSAAFISDTSHFGATSPVQGERYRLEAAPTFGTISFTNVLGDYRRYLMPVPFYTIAVRALHYGRYGEGADDGRLAPLYLGYPTLVRGYDVNSYTAHECVAITGSSCPVFDRLLGSRVLVANIEVRFPLLRPMGVSRGMYGPLPVELAVFTDTGVAWKKGERPTFAGGTRQGVSSAGLTVRVNLLGFAVGQFDLARPFDRPDAGWVYQFSLTPGF